MLVPSLRKLWSKVVRRLVTFFWRWGVRRIQTFRFACRWNPQASEWCFYQRCSGGFVERVVWLACITWIWDERLDVTCFELSSFALEATFQLSENGEYIIDYLTVEQAIRPLTVQWKKQLVLWLYPKSIELSYLYTFIETCKQDGYFVQELLSKGHERTPDRKGRLREPASTDYRSQI